MSIFLFIGLLVNGHTWLGLSLITLWVLALLFLFNPFVFSENKEQTFTSLSLFRKVLVIACLIYILPMGF